MRRLKLFWYRNIVLFRRCSEEKSSCRCSVCKENRLAAVLGSLSAPLSPPFSTSLFVFNVPSFYQILRLFDTGIFTQGFAVSRKRARCLLWEKTLKFSSRSFPAYVSGFNWVGGHNLAPGGGNWAICPAPNHPEQTSDWFIDCDTCKWLVQPRRRNGSTLWLVLLEHGVFAQMENKYKNTVYLSVNKGCRCWD